MAPLFGCGRDIILRRFRTFDTFNQTWLAGYTDIGAGKILAWLAADAIYAAVTPNQAVFINVQACRPGIHWLLLLDRQDTPGLRGSAIDENGQHAAAQYCGSQRP
jgi:hypothetical protein